MSYGILIEAEYESGFVLREDGDDHSPYDPGRNIFHAILHARPTDCGHGRMVRFTAIGYARTWSIDWRDLWKTDNPRPIYYRNMHKTDEVSLEGDLLTEGEPVCDGHFFGFQYLDADGKNVQQVERIG